MGINVLAKTRKPKPSSDTRERILQAAANEFAANGFAGGRLDTICTAAPVNIRMIYHHFGDKEGLYRSLLVEAFEAGLKRYPPDMGLTPLDGP